MEARQESGRPAIIQDDWNDMGEPITVCHIMTIGEARKLRDELSRTIEEVQQNELDEARKLIMHIGCVADSETPKLANKWMKRNFPSYA